MNGTRICSISDCDRKHDAHGFCKMHDARNRRLGDPLAPVYKRRPLEERFRSHYVIDESTGCFDWTSFCQRGYGQFTVSREVGSVRAHRWAYENAVGPIPEGLTIDHLCRNTRCVNPEHMEPVTASENVKRARRAQTHCKRGHEFTPENTHRTMEAGYPKRTCRACSALRVSANYHKNADAIRTRYKERCAELAQQNPYNVRVGQVWVSANKRDTPTLRVVVKVDGDRAQLNGYKTTWVRLDRFHPYAQGYLLVSGAAA